MMKRSALYILLLFYFGLQQTLYAQQTDTIPKVYKIVVFAPLYLDSAFTNSQLDYDKPLPKFIMPAVDFIQGSRIALDTMETEGKQVQAYIYDSKSQAENISWLIKYKKLDDVDMIIGSVKDPDYHQLADFALQKNIPFVSATYPNDGGIIANPYLFIVNSTLKANCEGIFSYLLQKHGTDKIYIIKRKGDDRVDNFFRELNTTENKPLLNIRTILVDSTISSYSLLNRIDSNHTAVIIGASLDESFAKNLADACFPIQKKHSLVLIGMPNWDGFKSLSKRDTYKDFPIRYTTPHYFTRNTYFDSLLTKKYFQLYRTKPSDMAYKGFGITYYFTKLLLSYPLDFITHLNDSAFTVFHYFNFRPVYIDKKNKLPDYYENKHVFIMEILNGDIIREW